MTLVVLNTNATLQGTNRTLLKWLKMWDYVVFGKERKVTKTNTDEQSKTKELQHGKFVNKRLPEVSEELDNFNRPLQKVGHIKAYHIIIIIIIFVFSMAPFQKHGLFMALYSIIIIKKLLKFYLKKSLT